MINNSLALYKKNFPIDYPLSPINPDIIYPELIHLSKEIELKVDETNQIYSSVRETLALLGLDKENFNKEHWNPLKDLVRPGEVVFIKPNMIAEKPRKNKDWDYVITNGSVIRPIVDYLSIAMKGQGRVVFRVVLQTASEYSALNKFFGSIN